jgi:hypothetical protein
VRVGRRGLGVGVTVGTAVALGVAEGVTVAVAGVLGVVEGVPRVGGAGLDRGVWVPDATDRAETDAPACAAPLL